MPSWLWKSNGSGLSRLRFRSSKRSSKRGDTSTQVKASTNEAAWEHSEHGTPQELPELRDARASKTERELAALGKDLRRKEQIETDLAAKIEQLELDLNTQAIERQEKDAKIAKQARSKEKLRHGFEEEIKRLQSTTDDLFSENEALEITISEKKSQNEALVVENEKLHRKYEKLTETSASHDRELAKAQGEADELRSQVSGLQRQLQDLRVSTDKEKDELCADAKRTLKELRASMKEEKEELQQNLEDTQALVKEFEDNLRAVKDSYKTAKKERERLRSELEKSEESHARTTKLLSDATSRQKEEKIKKPKAVLIDFPPTPPTPPPGILTTPISWSLDYDLNDVYSRRFYCVATAQHGGRCGCNFKFLSSRLAEATAIVSKMRSTDPGETFERASLHNLAFLLMCSDLHAKNDYAVTTKSNQWYDMLAQARAQLQKAKDARKSSLGAPPMFVFGRS